MSDNEELQSFVKMIIKQDIENLKKAVSNEINSRLKEMIGYAKNAMAADLLGPEGKSIKSMGGKSPKGGTTNPMAANQGQRDTE